MCVARDADANADASVSLGGASGGSEREIQAAAVLLRCGGGPGSEYGLVLCYLT